MSRNIRGITIEIGGNTQKLEKALSGVNSKSRDLQSELKQVDRLLKLDPKNTELLAQKQKILNETISNTKEKLTTLKEAEKQVREQFEKGKVGEEQYRAIQREVVAVENDLKKLEKQLKNTNNSWKDAADKLDKFGKRTGEIGKKIAPISAIMAGAGIAATKMGSDFADAIAKVSTIADTAEVPLEDLRRQILELSNQTGISASEIANNVYDAISAGQRTGDAIAFVERSTRLAKAGFASAGQSLDILTTIMNAYGLEADQVGQVSDTLIQIQNKGKVTVGELSSVMGRLIPTANAAGVGLDQVGAGYAILTSRGIRAAEATTYMNAMLDEMSKTGSRSDKAIRELTGKSFQQLIREGRSVADVLAILDENSKKNGLSLADMFGSTNAAKAALTLLGEDASNFNELVKEMNGSLGATQQAFDKLQTPGEKARIAFNKLKNVMIELGDIVLPIVARIAESIGAFADKLLGMNETTKTVIVVIVGLLAALSPILIIIGKLSTAISAIITLISGFGAAAGAATAATAGATTATGGLSAVMAALTGPIGIAIAAILAAAAGIIYLWKTNENFRNKIKEIWQQVKEIISLAIEFVQGIIDAFVYITSALWKYYGETITFITDTIWSTITSIIEGAIKIIKGIIEVFIGIVTLDWNRFTGGLSKIWEGMWDIIEAYVRGAWDLLKGAFMLLKDSITGWFSDLANSAFDWGRNMISGFIDGIKSMASAVSNAVKGVISNVKSFIGFNSPTEKGEGRFIKNWGYNMIQGFMDGIRKAVPELQSTVAAAISDTKKAIESNNTSVNNYGHTVHQTLNFHTATMTPSEVARQAKRASQELALEW